MHLLVKTNFFFIENLFVFFILATIFSVIELIIIICSLIAHKFIEMKLQEEEKELYRLLTEDERNPNWHQLIRIPRDMTLSDDEFSQEPPPYND